MPCDASYMDPTAREKSLSVVACLLDELDGLTVNDSYRDGFHPRVYCQPVDGDALVAQLCQRLQAVDVTTYSLEMQIWWRDHKKADQARVQKELDEKQKQKDIQAALSKLSQHERSLLGYEPRNS